MKIEPISFLGKDGTPYILRSPQQGEGQKLLDQLCQVCRESDYLNRYPDEIHITVEQEEEFIQGLLEGDRKTMIGIFQGEDLVGSLSIRGVTSNYKQSHIAEIGISIIQAHQGRGLGKKLMELAETWAREQGFPMIQLSVYSPNTHARKLYEGCGYTIMSILPEGCIFRDGSCCDEIFMYKKL